MKSNQALHKKIVAGKFKGKTLLLPSKETTRSLFLIQFSLTLSMPTLLRFLQEAALSVLKH